MLFAPNHSYMLSTAIDLEKHKKPQGKKSIKFEEIQLTSPSMVEVKDWVAEGIFMIYCIIY
jgi:hypothetical protein